MKKYLLSLFVLVYVFGIFNINLAKAITVPASDCIFTSTLRLGSVGDEVACLQVRLGLSVDGKFGRQTKATVLAWQKKSNLSVDGIFGRKSRIFLFLIGAGFSSSSFSSAVAKDGADSSSATPV